MIETEAVQQGGAALAAECDESGRMVLPGEAEAENGGEATQRRLAGLDGLPQEAQGGGLGMAGVSTIEPEEHRLEEPVVAASDELVEAGREAAASDVLEQKSAEEAGELAGREAQLVRDAHPKDAGAEGVPGSGALSEVESQGQRGEALGEGNCGEVVGIGEVQNARRDGRDCH